jgi:hypothetical protein
VHGDRSERAHDPAYDGHRKERRLGEERDAPRREAEEQKRIDQAVRVVDDEDHGSRSRDPFHALELDPPEEDAQGLPEEQAEDPPHEAASPLRAA